MVRIVRSLSCVCLLLCLAAGQASAERKVKIAVLDVNAVGAFDAKTIAGLSTLIAYEASQYNFQVISGADVRALITHDRQKQLLGCSDSSCLTEVGGALGVEYILSSEVSEVGGVWLVSLTLIDVAKSSAAKRVIRKTTRESHLVRATTDATEEIFRGFKLAESKKPERARKRAPEPEPVAAPASPPEPEPVAAAPETGAKAEVKGVPAEAIAGKAPAGPRFRRRSKGMMIAGIALVVLGVAGTLAAIPAETPRDERLYLVGAGTLCAAVGTPLWIIGRKMVPAQPKQKKAEALSLPEATMVLSVTPTGLQLVF
ncbi:MAG: hypothetical protein ACOX6T_08510 [Myxococcales bacterium]|jgi:hypothetical protein